MLGAYEISRHQPSLFISSTSPCPESAASLQLSKRWSVMFSVSFLNQDPNTQGSRSGGSESHSFLPTHDAVDCGAHKIGLISSLCPEHKVSRAEVIPMST